MFFTKSCFYASVAIAIGIPFASCNSTFNAGVPPPPTNNAQPVVQPLRLSKPKKIAWADVKAIPARPVVTTLDWDKLPQQADDTTGFRPFKYPVQETKFDYNALPAKSLDINKLPSRPLKFKSYMLPAPKLVKGAKPELKNGNLYLLGVSDDETVSGTEVTRLLRDKDGFLWMACTYGLYRFDGENLLAFLSFPDETYDYGMVQDSLGNIWMPNQGSPLMVLDPKAGILKKAAPNQNLDNLTHLMVDSRQRIWTTGQNGEVNLIDPNAQTVKTLSSKNGLFTSNRTAGIGQDKSGKIWVSTGGGGMNILDPENKTMKHLDHAHGLLSDRLNNILFDRSGRLWVGMYGGTVQVIDPQNKTIQTIRELQSNAQGVFVACLSQDDAGRVWIGTTASGATGVDLEKRQFIHLSKNNGLAANDVLDIRQDDKEQMWIATGLGLNMIAAPTGVVTHSGSDYVSNLMEDSRGLIWKATTANGIDILDRKRRTIRHLGIKEGLLSDTVYFIEQTNQGIFISTSKSLEILDTVKKTTTHFSSNYSNILFDKAGRVWYLDENETGINLYDPKDQTVKHFGKDILQLNSAVYFMCLDERGRIWLSNSFGEVAVIDPDAGAIQFLANIKRGRKNSTAFFFRDDKGNIWIGTDKGIYIADLKKQNVVHFSTAQGLINNKVLSIQQYKGNIYAGTSLGVSVITPPAEGISAKKTWRVLSYDIPKQNANSYNSDLVTKDGIYWSGDKGATAFDLAKKDSLKSQPYIKGLSLYDRPIYFYAKKGANSPATDTLWLQNGAAYLLNGETPANTSYAFQSGLRWDGVAGSNNIPVNLRMPYNQNFVHLHYGNLNLVPHDTTRYRYMLNGVDKTWNDVTADTLSANYMNLQPGNYTFEVISRNAENVWGRPAKFGFTINPPWWQTWWAYVIYVFAFAGGIWSFVRYRSHQLVKEKRVLENKVRLATEEIVQQKEEIAAQRDSLEGQRNNLEKTLVELKTTQTQLIQSEKMASLGELTAGIAHEIQNPLNFVNNFSEVSVELLEELTEEAKAGHNEDVIAIAGDLTQNLQKINHHGKRADGIVKGMLEHSRSHSGQKEPTDLNAMADEFMRLSYHGLRSKDKAFNSELTTQFDVTLPKISVVQQDIGRVMLNLFNNAFYAVNQKLKTVGAGYKAEVTVSTFSESGKMVIKVKDNGVGIPDAIKEKIMQPFFTTKPTGEGTGLGLSLTYDMVVKGHGGSIQVNSVEGEGSEFIVTLPVS